MPYELLVALLSLAGTLAGSLAGILTANRMTVYRIEQLEKKVDKHNAIIERTALLERDSKTLFHYIDDIRTEIKRRKDA